jgi:hypothetical protein
MILSISLVVPLINNQVTTNAYLSYLPNGTHSELIWSAVNSLMSNITDDLEFFNCWFEINGNNSHYYDLLCQAQEDYDSFYFRQWEQYWNPQRLAGLYGDIGAPYHAQEYFTSAVNLYPNNKNESYYTLGYAIHLLQDVTVPHHANLDPFGQHTLYEQFCDQQHKEGNIILPTVGNYVMHKDWYGNYSIRGWVHKAAKYSYQYYNQIENEPYDYTTWLDIATHLMGKAVELTAGLIFYFWQYVNDLDIDHDGLGAKLEHIKNADPIKQDTDADSINDLEEVVTGNDTYITNPGSNDTDNDQLSDPEEISIYFTNPTVNDTDTDGFLDGVEIKLGYDPLNSSDHPPYPETTPTAGYEITMPIIGFFFTILMIYIRRQKTKRLI